MNIRPIKTESDYQEALQKIDTLFDAKLGTPECDQLDILSTLAAAYEEVNYPIKQPNYIELIHHYMDACELPRRDLSELSSIEDLHNQLNESLRHLSQERLKALVAFAAYLADSESEAATQELLAIPGLLAQVKQSRKAPTNQYIDWKTVRSDVQDRS